MPLSLAKNEDFIKGGVKCSGGVVISQLARLNQMVYLHIKKAEESQFLFETTVNIPLEELIVQLVRLYNGRLKVERLCQGKSGRDSSITSLQRWSYW